MASATPVELGGLTEGQRVSGFRTEAVYVASSDRPIGARFKHLRTGFYARLTVAADGAAGVFVGEYATHLRYGEPHTQGALAAGQGNQGRSVATLEQMSMTSSSAMTMQWRTCFHFPHHGGAGRVL